MSVNSNEEGRLVYTLNIGINLLQFSSKYPKNPQNFGQRLRKKRMDLGLTIRGVAEKVGVSETTVYNWEIRNTRPYRRTEEKLKAILDLTEEIFA